MRRALVPLRCPPRARRDGPPGGAWSRAPIGALRQRFAGPLRPSHACGDPFVCVEVREWGGARCPARGAVLWVRALGLGFWPRWVEQLCAAVGGGCCSAALRVPCPVLGRRLAWLGGMEPGCRSSCCRYLASWLRPPVMGPL